MQQEAKCTPNNQCKCIVSMKTGYAYYVNAQFLLQMLNANLPIWIPNYYSKANLDLMQVQCKMHNAMHDDKQMFLDFLKIKRYKKQKNDSTHPRLYKHT